MAGRGRGRGRGAGAWGGGPPRGGAAGAGGGGGGGGGAPPPGGRGGAAGGGGGGGPPRGGPGGVRGGRGGPVRGGGPAAGGGPPSGPPARVGLPADHIQTVGVKRTAFGTAGRPVEVWTNHFAMDIPQTMIYHYDAMTPSEQTLPLRLNMKLIKHLQETVAPQVFTPRAVYDGRKNLFAVSELPFTDGSMTFDVSLPDETPRDSSSTRSNQPARPAGRSPKVYKVKLTKVAEINPEVLIRFLEGKQSHDNVVLTAITALNVVVRHEPTMRWPFNVRSFFTDRETRPIGSGIVLWRGYFQSVRPGIGRMLMNIDISTAAMYRPGSLIELMMDFFGRPVSQAAGLNLAGARSLSERDRLQVQRFIQGVKITTSNSGAPRTVKKLSQRGANLLRFQLRDGPMLTVAEYFQQTHNLRLRYPDMPCVELQSGALIPIELCTVPPGQIMRKQVPPDRTKDVLNFATKRPEERLASIKEGLGVLQYGQSEYVRQFGLHIHQESPLSVRARVLQPPTLVYGAQSRQRTIIPRDGSWNMVDKKFHKAATIGPWVMAIFESPGRFNEQAARETAEGLMKACANVGMQDTRRQPVIRHCRIQNNIRDEIKKIGADLNREQGAWPNLVVCILPEGAADTYQAIKHAGDIELGVATQCMKSLKCFRAKEQYYANVCLKINVKLGGINTVPEAGSLSLLVDPKNPTVVMGADVIHPAAHSEGRPSYTALVANIDNESAKYVATSRVQTSRQEMIDDLQEMAEHVLRRFMIYRAQVEKRQNAAPKRIIFYRDGVSEGQFKQVLEKELPLLKKACETLKIAPTITVIVVGKRHHVRFFPKDGRDADRSGNCRAGTVVDTDIAHPTELDFYLQSHAGLLGTSRPAHYSVLYDENNFSVDGLQALSFALCHVYARSTRSVSIPAPVYYADIVCSRAKNHYSPGTEPDSSDGQTVEGTQAEDQLEAYKNNFKPLHAKMTDLMYFS